MLPTAAADKLGRKAERGVTRIMTRRTTNNKPSLVCFAGCDWWYHNRGLFCPQVMRRLAKRYNVLFVNSLGMRVPSLKDDKHALQKVIRKIRSQVRFLKKTDDGMYVFTPFSVPLFKSRLGRSINSMIVLLQVTLLLMLLRLRRPIFYIGCPPAWQIVKKLRPKYVIYERTDIFSEMPGADKGYITELDDELSRSADLVLYVNRAMWSEGLKHNANSMLLGHGVDFDLFAHAEQAEYVPTDIGEISKPIIGFFGDVCDDWCDFALLEHIARELPEMSLVLVGAQSSDVSGLQGYENVHLLGQKPYEEICHYGRMFDVAIMPWNKNRWIEFCNPVKTKEYLSLGKPVVSVRYPEIEPFAELVYIADDYDEFVSCIRKAAQQDGPDKSDVRKASVQDETWDSKVMQIVEHCEGAQLQEVG